MVRWYATARRLVGSARAFAVSVGLLGAVPAIVSQSAVPDVPLDRWDYLIGEPSGDVVVDAVLANDARVVVIDLFDHDTATVDQLHDLGVVVLGYLSVGTWEPWRPDAGDFPPELLGASLEPPFGEERWLDVRRTGAGSPAWPVLRAIMEARLDLARAKGFDGVDPDNVDGWDNETGFDLAKRDARRYLGFLSNEAHARGLAMGLKNALRVRGTKTAWYERRFEFFVNEECERYEECDFYEAVEGPVFHVEYREADFLRACAAGYPRFTSIWKRLALDSLRYETCEP